MLVVSPSFPPENFADALRLMLGRSRAAGWHGGRFCYPSFVPEPHSPGQDRRGSRDGSILDILYRTSNLGFEILSCRKNNIYFTDCAARL